MTQTKLLSLKPGDLFHAEQSGGGTRIALVLSNDGRTRHARRITTQQEATFNIETGTASIEPGICAIDSIEPLSPELRQAMLDYDETARLAPTLPFRPLMPQERDAILAVERFYRKHPLHGEAS